MAANFRYRLNDLQSLLFFLFSFVCIGGLGTGASAAVVEGDPALLRLLTAAQETGKASFPRGALEATVHSVIPGQAGYDVDLSAKVVWDGPATFWDYEEVIKSKNVEPRTRRVKMIETPAGRVHFWPDAKLVQTITDGSGGYRQELRLRPDQCWFFSDTGTRAWSELFDIGTNDRPPRVPFDKLAVYRDGDSITVERHIVGRVYRIRASLRAGGNIVEYETTPTREHPEWKHGTFEWAPVGGERWRLLRHDWVFSIRGDKKNPERGYLLEVSKFDPDPAIPANRFDIESLEIPTGTVIERIGPGRRDRRLTGYSPTTQRNLDELAEFLRRRGFAATDTKANH